MTLSAIVWLKRRRFGVSELREHADLQRSVAGGKKEATRSREIARTFRIGEIRSLLFF
jgi:hypothetical protein